MYTLHNQNKKLDVRQASGYIRLPGINKIKRVHFPNENK